MFVVPLNSHEIDAPASTFHFVNVFVFISCVLEIHVCFYKIVSGRMLIIEYVMVGGIHREWMKDGTTHRPNMKSIGP